MFTLQIPGQRFSCLVPAGAGAVDKLGNVAGPFRRAGENAAARQLTALPALDHAAVLRAGVLHAVLPREVNLLRSRLADTGEILAGRTPAQQRRGKTVAAFGEELTGVAVGAALGGAAAFEERAADLFSLALPSIMPCGAEYTDEISVI